MMRPAVQMNKQNNKRLRFLTYLIVFVGLIFAGRLFDRQVLSRDEFTALAERQYYTKIDQPAIRGNIYIHDKDSQNLIDESKTGLFPVANDIELFNLAVVPRNIVDKDDAATKIAPIIGEKKEDLFTKINQDKWYIPPLKKKISKEEADKIAALNLKGVFLEGQYSRFYPEKEFLAQVLGFVDYDGNGKYGIEGYYDGALKGEKGVLTGMKDNLGRVIKVDQSEPGKSGADIILTIDRSIQYMAEKKLKEGMDRYGADGGTIIIMDPKTGAILAMVSSPSYDPNKFNEISGDGQSIFLNPATSSNWEPGSIFKPLITAGAIDANLLQPDSKPSPQEGGFTNQVTVDGYTIHNALDKSYGFETVTQILENSDNIGMVWVANKMGNDIMSQFITKLGFGQKTGIDVSGESAGQVASVKNWRDVSRATMSFGQGISATPIQIMQAIGALANKGQMNKPHILDKQIYNGQEKNFESAKPVQVMTEDTAKKSAEMMVSVVENGHGKLAGVAGYRVAGKTGTAQIPKAGGGYEEGSSIGSFAGFAPADDPRFVMLVKLNRPKNVQWAESSAAPIFGEIADWLLNSYLKVPKTQ